MEIKSLQIISDYELCCAWQRAFVDYGMSATNENLLAMFHRRGYCAEVSFGAFTDKEEFVSMTLNGLGYFDGIYSAYDTSTGTAIEFRKQGLAKRIFQHMQSALRDRGVKQYVLEVLKNNEAAKALYTKIGFTISREFFYFRQTVATVQSALQSKDEAIQTADKIIQIEEISLPALQSISHMWDFQPSWQNSHESMQRKRSVF